MLPAVLALFCAPADVPLGLDLYRPAPADNIPTPAKVALGRRLFSETLLSRDRSLSCASCHDPARAFTDGRAVARGVFGRVGKRNTPTLVNRVYGSSFFWDGRAPALEKQVLEPVFNPNELGLTPVELERRLKLPPSEIARALASYLRAILSGSSAYDHYLNGDLNSLSEEARRGLTLFRGKANCIACHAGPNFTDERFHNTGVAWRDGRFLDDGRAMVTGRLGDRGAFKTPTLRETARTAPYMHDGNLATLEDVIEYYNLGGNANPALDSQLRRLNLTALEKEELLAFLRSLSGMVVH